MKQLCTVMLGMLLFSACAAAPQPVGDLTARKAAADQDLDAWHLAASRASEADYIDQGMTADGIFLGTDPDERWTRESFRAYVKPHFSKGKGWTLKSTRRWLSFNAAGDTAWFDEDLNSKELGPARGTGVMVWVWADGRWKVAQYNLSIPIPNEDFDAVKKVIAKRAKRRDHSR